MRPKSKIMASFLKGHSGQKFSSVFSQKKLTNMKTNFTKFELSANFRSQNMTI